MNSPEELVLIIETLFKEDGVIIISSKYSRDTKKSYVFFYPGSSFKAIPSNVSDLWGLLLSQSIRIKRDKKTNGIVGIVSNSYENYKYSSAKTYLIGFTISSSDLSENLLNHIYAINNEIEASLGDFTAVDLEFILIFQIKKMYIYIYEVIASKNYKLILELLLQLIFISQKIRLYFIEPKYIPKLFNMVSRNQLFLKKNRLKVSKLHENVTRQLFFDFLSKYLQTYSQLIHEETNTLASKDDIRNYLYLLDKEALHKILKRGKIILDSFKEMDAHICMQVSKRSYEFYLFYDDGEVKYRVES